MNIKFSDFTKYLDGYIQGDDIHFLGKEDAKKLPESLYALANSFGGWLVFGAEYSDFDDTVINISGLEDKNIPDTVKNLSSIKYKLQFIENPELFAIFRVLPLKWYKKPVMIDDKVYRSIDGENVISGKKACSIIIQDALNFSRDDYPINSAQLDENCMNEFRRSVIKIHDEYKIFSRDEFFRRTFMYSGKYLTFAGALMFGECIKIRAVLDDECRHAEIEARNIWRAYRDILPRITYKLSDKCAAAFREAFVNSLLHSDYSIDKNINVNIFSRPARVIIDNPGLIRGAARNYRLEKIFRLSGISKGNGLKVIRNYERAFRLEQDTLNFRTKAMIRLEGVKELPDLVII